MAGLTERYYNGDLGTGNDDGTSEANAWQTWASIAASNPPVPGDRVNFMRTVARDVLGSAQTFAISGDKDNPIHLRGNGGVIGDGGFYQADERIIIFGENVVVEEFDIEASSSLAALQVVGDGSRAYRCKAYNTDASGSGGAGLSIVDGAAINCWIKNNSTSTNEVHSTLSLARGFVSGCRIIRSGTGASAISLDDGRYQSVINCLITANGQKAIRFTPTSITQNNIIHGNTIWDFEDGIYLEELSDLGSFAVLSIVNNVFYNGSGTGIINVGANTAVNIFMAGNAFGAITVANFSGFGNDADGLIFDSIQLTADPFNGAVGGDFSLNDDLNGGAELRSAGIPTDIDLDGAQDNWLDVGALQVEPSGGGDLPIVGDVRDGVSYDNGNLEGVLDLPAESNVVVGIQFDNLTKTGTFGAVSTPSTSTERYAEEVVIQRLVDNAAVNNLVQNRISPDFTTQSLQRPYITVSRIDGEHVHHMTAASGVVLSRIQVDGWANTHAEAAEVRNACRFALDHFSGIVIVNGESVDVSLCIMTNDSAPFSTPTASSDRGAYRVTMDFKVATPESVPTFV